MLRETVGHLRDLPRYRQILGVLVHYGYQDLLAALNLEGLAKPIGWVARAEVPPPEPPQRVRLVCEALGPTFIKLGQLLSTRQDLLSEAYTAELAQLREDAPTFAFEEVQAILREEWGRDPSEVFASFDPEPVASASISQVHRAILPSGRAVAVKVRRPGIEKTVQADLDILRHLAELAEKRLPFLKPYGPLAIAREFERTLRRELDLTIERRTMERCRAQFADDSDGYVPEPFRDLCTNRVLVMEFVEGLRIEDREALGRVGLEPKELAKRGSRVLLKQIFRFGLFHADPHPGNLRVLADGRIAILDYGMFGYLDRTTRERIADLLTGLLAQETDQVLRAMEDLQIHGEDVDAPSLRRDVGEIVSAYADLSLQNIDLRLLLGELVGVMRTHHLRLPPELVLLTRSLITIEALGRSLDPEFDIAAQLKPAIQRLTLKRFGPKRMLQQSARTLQELHRVATILPGVLGDSLESIRRGELNLKFDLKDFEHLVQQLVRASNTLAIGIVLAGLLVASSTLIRIENLPSMGYVGLGIALVLGFWLVWYMSRKS